MVLQLFDTSRITLRYGMSFDAPVFPKGELGWDSDMHVLRVGDGVTNGEIQIATSTSKTFLDYSLTPLTTLPKTTLRGSGSFDGVNFKRLNANNGILSAVADSAIQFESRSFESGDGTIVFTNPDGIGGNISISLDPEIIQEIDSAASPLLSVVHDSTMDGAGTIGSPLTLVQATTTQVGGAMLASSAEISAGADSNKALSPQNLLGVTAGAFITQLQTLLNTLAGANHSSSLQGTGSTASPLGLAPATTTIEGGLTFGTQAQVNAGISGTEVVSPYTLTHVDTGSALATSLVSKIGGITGIEIDATLTGDGKSSAPLTATIATETDIGVARVSKISEVEAGLSTSSFLTPSNMINAASDSPIMSAIRNIVLPKNTATYIGDNTVKFKPTRLRSRMLRTITLNKSRTASGTAASSMAGGTGWFYQCGQFRVRRGKKGYLIVLALACDVVGVQYEVLINGITATQVADSQTRIRYSVNGVPAEHQLVAFHLHHPVDLSNPSVLVRMVQDVSCTVWGHIAIHAVYDQGIFYAQKSLSNASAAYGPATTDITFSNETTTAAQTVTWADTVPSNGMQLVFGYATQHSSLASVTPAITGTGDAALATITSSFLAKGTTDIQQSSVLQQLQIDRSKSTGTYNTNVSLSTNAYHLQYLTLIYAPDASSEFIHVPSGSYSWTVPVNVNSISAKLWGPGGGAGGSTPKLLGGHGSSGAYVSSDFAVTPGEVLTIRVHNGGAGGIYSPEFVENKIEYIPSGSADGDYTFVIPTDAKSIQIDALGAAGATVGDSAGFGIGGPGGFVSGTFPLDGSLTVDGSPLVPGATLRVRVGAPGTLINNGNTGLPGLRGTGGNLTGVFVGASAVLSTSQSRALAVAGSGGGGSKISYNGTVGYASGGSGGGAHGDQSDSNGQPPIISSTTSHGGGGAGYWGGNYSNARGVTGYVPASGNFGGEGGSNFVLAAATNKSDLSRAEFNNRNPKYAIAEWAPYGNSAAISTGTNGGGRVVLRWFTQNPMMLRGTAGGEGGGYTGIFRGATPLAIAGGGGGGGGANANVSVTGALIAGRGGFGGVGSGSAGINGSGGHGLHGSGGSITLGVGNKATGTNATDGVSLTGGNASWSALEGGMLLARSHVGTGGRASFSINGGGAGGGAGYIGGGGSEVGQVLNGAYYSAGGAGGGASIDNGVEGANMSGDVPVLEDLDPDTPNWEDADFLIGTCEGGVAWNNIPSGKDYGSVMADGGDGLVVISYEDGNVVKQVPGVLRRDGNGNLSWKEHWFDEPFLHLRDVTYSDGLGSEIDAVMLKKWTPRPFQTLVFNDPRLASVGHYNENFLRFQRGFQFYDNDTDRFDEVKNSTQLFKTIGLVPGRYLMRFKAYAGYLSGDVVYRLWNITKQRVIGYSAVYSSTAQHGPTVSMELAFNITTSFGSRDWIELQAMVTTRANNAFGIRPEINTGNTGITQIRNLANLFLFKV